MTKPHEQQDLEAAESYADGFFGRHESASWLSEKTAFLAGCRHKEAQLASELAAKDAEIARLREALEKIAAMPVISVFDEGGLGDNYIRSIAGIIAREALADKAGKGEKP